MPGNDRFARLLMHFDGANGSTSFTDSTSPDTNKGAATVIAPAQVSTAQSVFGGASVLLNCPTGLGGDGLIYANSADWDFGSGDFTLECWVRLTQYSATGFFDAFLGHMAAGYDYGNRWIWGSNENGIFYFDQQTAGAFVISVGTANFVIPLNSWCHVALVRFGSNFTLYVNGVASGTTTYAGALANQSGTLTIGTLDSAGNHGMTGYMDELRISKGVARWTANFIPPTAPYNAYIGFDNEDNTKDFPVLSIKHRVAEY